MDNNYAKHQIGLKFCKNSLSLDANFIPRLGPFYFWIQPSIKNPGIFSVLGAETQAKTKEMIQTPS